MPKMHIEKSIVINKPVDQVFKILNDFTKWSSWSPWLIQDPKAKVDVAEDTKYYSWEGPRVGSGNMKIVKEEENKFIDYDLNFLKPWKSYAKVYFHLSQEENSTKVTWSMDSSLPFFMFFMKKMMVALIGMDYDRGLLMLKDYAEEGQVNSSLEFTGLGHFEGFRYIGIRTECNRDEIGEQMKNDFMKLGEFFEDKQDIVKGPAFSIYHKWDFVKGDSIYTSGIPVSEIPSKLPNYMCSGTLSSSNTYSIKHKGPYHHLGNAWSTLYNIARGKTFKQLKKKDPFEIYLNSPMEVDPKELLTQVYIPCK